MRSVANLLAVLPYLANERDSAPRIVERDVVADLLQVNFGRPWRGWTIYKDDRPLLQRDHASGLSDNVLLERMQASGEACAVDVALCEKPYELPSPTIWGAKNSVICRLLSNFNSGLTVKIRNRMTKKFYRKIYRQNDSPGGDRCR